MRFIKDRMGISEYFFARRWMLDLGLFSLRIHHWTGSDDPRAYHDHPSWFVTIVLWGGYEDIQPCACCNEPQRSSARDRLKMGSIRFRRAEHTHTVQNLHPNTWTLCIFGKPSRRWNFFINGKRLKRDKYFAVHGHHTEGDPVRIKPNGERIV